MTVRHAVGKQPEFPTFLKTLNWRDGTGDNSPEYWTHAAMYGDTRTDENLSFPHFHLAQDQVEL